MYSLGISSGSAPVCGDISEFGSGRVLLEGPLQVRSGYYEGVGKNSSNTTCVRCLTRPFTAARWPALSTATYDRVEKAVLHDLSRLRLYLVLWHHPNV